MDILTGQQKSDLTIARKTLLEVCDRIAKESGVALEVTVLTHLNGEPRTKVYIEKSQAAVIHPNGSWAHE